MFQMIEKGMRRRRKETRYVSFVTFIAVLFMTGLALFQNIMNNYVFSTNLHNYGDWVISSVGRTCSHPYLMTESFLKTGQVLVNVEGKSLELRAGMMDEDFGNVYDSILYEGRMPEADGEILLKGESILHLKDKEVSKLRRSQIGFIYQDYSLLPEFTAYENIIFPIRLDGKKPEKDKIEELMMVLGILSCKDKFPGEMSGGEDVPPDHYHGNP